jgi:hypothetical protein
MIGPFRSMHCEVKVKFRFARRLARTLLTEDLRRREGVRQEALVITAASSAGERRPVSDRRPAVCLAVTHVVPTTSSGAYYATKGTENVSPSL